MNSAPISTNAIIESHHTQYSQLTTYFDEQHELLWTYMRGMPRPCFTPGLLEELLQLRNDLVDEIDAPSGRSIKYMVMASDIPGVFNLGGDLELIKGMVLTKDRDGLLSYARACIDLLYTNINQLDREVTMISLVQGDALGGGFEGAMSSNIIIAERSARMGFPEILFNMFPGMGAYSLLLRKTNNVRAEKMILSGRVYTAEELYELGIVDVLAEDKQGEVAVYKYIKQANKSYNGMRALRAAARCVNPINYDELMNIADIWVDAALRLKNRDLRMMEWFIARQSGLRRRREKQQADYID